ncbi:hypothetical protein [Paracoccus mutanolyticus]|uniref:hypothetical protein n=1 Tax=Paracoccus mutanolyticus TaxID=1499308 RepID=UPI0016749389|nr:hypothetical protein [Paracoccus mutanolyticus]
MPLVAARTPLAEGLAATCAWFAEELDLRRPAAKAAESWRGGRRSAIGPHEQGCTIRSRPSR